MPPVAPPASDRPARNRRSGRQPPREEAPSWWGLYVSDGSEISGSPVLKPLRWNCMAPPSPLVLTNFQTRRAGLAAVGLALEHLPASLRRATPIVAPCHPQIVTLKLSPANLTMPRSLPGPFGVERTARCNAGNVGPAQGDPGPGRSAPAVPSCRRCFRDGHRVRRAFELVTPGRGAQRAPPYRGLAGPTRASACPAGAVIGNRR